MAKGNKEGKSFTETIAHENVHRTDQVEGSSEVVFGLTLGGVFLLFACWPLLHGGPVRWWAVGVAAAFVLAALMKPSLLTRPNRLWAKLGFVLGRVASPVSLGIVFYMVLVPLGFVMRIVGKDSLRLKLEPDGKTYWIRRKPPGPPKGSMTKQF